MLAPVRFHATRNGPFPYREYIPDDPASGETFPLVFFLHGAGTRGDDGVALAGNSSFRALLGYIRSRGGRAILLAPQCPQDVQWVDTPWGGVDHPFSETPSRHMAMALELLDEKLAVLPVDRSRVYVCGNSMGGYATWDAAARRPGLFAAAMPVCGGGDPAMAERYRDLPVWIFHGDADPVVPVENTRRMAAALRADADRTAEFRVREYPGVTHDSWTATFGDPQVLDWFFAQRRAVDPAPLPADAFQRELDAISAPDYLVFRAAGPWMPEPQRLAAFVANPGLHRYDIAIDKVIAEVRKTEVSAVPAVWFVYNMGLVVKTPKTTFAIDLAHRQGLLMEPLLDFALVTHNHEDHVDTALLAMMDRHGKTVASNFLCNYGAVRGESMPGGYTRCEKTFEIGDVAIRCTLSDHNRYLADFTTAFEVSVGDWTLYHTGDSSNIDKLHPTRQPDLWVVHPRCGLNVADGVRKFHPKRTVIAHLFELGHPIDRWRWSIADGRAEAARAEAAGTEAVIPLWGERIV